MMSISEHQQSLQDKTSNTETAAIVFAIPIGLIAALIVPATVLSIFVGLHIAGHIDEPKTFDDTLYNIQAPIGSILFIEIFAIFFGAFQVAFVGVPAVFIGFALNLVRWWSSIIGGFFVGCLPFVAIELISLKNNPYTVDNPFHSWSYFWQTGLMMGALGAIGGFSFWLAWRLFEKKMQNRKIN